MNADWYISFEGEERISDLVKSQIKLMKKADNVSNNANNSFDRTPEQNV